MRLSSSPRKRPASEALVAGGVVVVLLAIVAGAFPTRAGAPRARPPSPPAKGELALRSARGEPPPLGRRWRRGGGGGPPRVRGGPLPPRRGPLALPAEPGDRAGPRHETALRHSVRHRR